jgi:hypothetical protein
VLDPPLNAPMTPTKYFSGAKISHDTIAIFGKKQTSLPHPYTLYR